MLPARYRLRQREEFSAVLRSRPTGGSRSEQRRTRAGSRYMVVHAKQTDARTGQPPRVGLVVPKAVGNAVVRNRTKRRLRALMATRLPVLRPGTDLVIRANSAAAQASFDELGVDLDRLLRKVVSA